MDVLALENEGGGKRWKETQSAPRVLTVSTVLLLLTPELRACTREKSPRTDRALSHQGFLEACAVWGTLGNAGGRQEKPLPGLRPSAQGCHPVGSQGSPAFCWRLVFSCLEMKGFPFYSPKKQKGSHIYRTQPKENTITNQMKSENKTKR